jgi:menaquinone-dependent protoporphyrinogen oxidase
MKILALYGSRFGQAEAVLRRVVRRLATAGHSVTMVNARMIPESLRLEDFDAVVVAASIILGRHQSYVRKWVRSNAIALSKLPGAFISVNGASLESRADWRKRAEEYVTQFAVQTGWHPRWTAAFSGALRYSRYDPITRWVMKRIAAKEGGPTDTSRDHELTDWEAVDRFAEKVVAGFGAAAPERSPAVSVA